ncbi:MAG: hypothetical protein M3Y24_03600 [Acidobacteriota bacterium]|nr:hypothetical protein [Acidobacteriota bacterium]
MSDEIALDFGWTRTGNRSIDHSTETGSGLEIEGFSFHLRSLWPAKDQ